MTPHLSTWDSLVQVGLVPFMRYSDLFNIYAHLDLRYARAKGSTWKIKLTIVIRAESASRSLSISRGVAKWGAGDQKTLWTTNTQKYRSNFEARIFSKSSFLLHRHGVMRLQFIWLYWSKSSFEPIAAINTTIYWRTFSHRSTNMGNHGPNRPRSRVYPWPRSYT